MNAKKLSAQTEMFYLDVLDRIRKNQLRPVLVSRSTFNKVKRITPQDEGRTFVVPIEGKKDRRILLSKSLVLMYPLDREGHELLDSHGRQVVKECSIQELGRRYTRVGDGIYARDVSPVYAVKIPDDMIAEGGIELAPPREDGNPIVLKRGGAIMLPYLKGKTLFEHIFEWTRNADWGVTNHAQVFAQCDPNGDFINPQLRAIFGQIKRDIGL